MYKRKKRGIMIQGTMSGVGKSVLAAGLCRVFYKDGLKTAPFKSQNMALNSYITKDGLEMGRAQVMQAEAAGTEPQACMNPILLKPTTDIGSQVIVNGKSIGNMKAKEYFKYKTRLIPDIEKAYAGLEDCYDMIVTEGAGSPAEINLKSQDIVNMGAAEMFDLPVILAGDIDRGGVFAQLVGTLELLEEHERDRIRGLVINKFRGDKSILEPGIEWLEKRTGIPVVGVIPYTPLALDEEDSMSGRFYENRPGIVDIAVIQFGRMANMSDFTVFDAMEGVSVRYVRSPRELGEPDMVILPGTKSTVADMKAIRENGLEAAIMKAASKGTVIFGICGGYQMMGLEISDPENAEGGGCIRGMGLIPMHTVFEEDKTVSNVSASFRDIPVKGYEMHMGKSSFDKKVTPFAYIEENGCIREDGFAKDNLYGTYLHGIFDTKELTEYFVRMLCSKKGIEYNGTVISAEQLKEREFDKLENMIRAHMDMDAVYKMTEVRQK